MRQLPTTVSSFIWYFTKRYKGSFLALFIINIYWAIHISILPLLLKYIIDIATTYKGDASGLYMALAWPAGIYVGAGFLLNFVFRLYDYIVMHVMPDLKADIVHEMFEYVENHSYNYFQNSFAGSIANKITDMARGVEAIVKTALNAFISRILMVIVAAVTMSTVSITFALLLVVWALSFLWIVKHFSLISHRNAEVMAHARSRVVAHVVDGITNVLNVKLFARKKEEIKTLDRLLETQIEDERKLHWSLTILKFFQGFSIAIFLFFVMWQLIYLRAEGRVTPGDFAFILSLSIAMIDMIWESASEVVLFSSEIGTCQQAISLIQAPHEIEDKIGAKLLQVTQGRIVFDRVSFEYSNGTKVFSDKSIIIHPGEKVGLVGISGSGKSTFVHLILRFFDVQSGSITIDDQNIQECTQESIRKSITMIPQDPLLFHRTLMENIKYGKEEAVEEEIMAAAKKAHCHEFIMQLKDGYHSLVGERGVKLSGGQRQRIAIARAILKDAPILILDEATSALDSITEQYIQESIETLAQGRTTLVIAHRLSTLKHMKRILVFSHGKIVEDGSHEALLAKNGQYMKLWNMQKEGFIAV